MENAQIESTWVDFFGSLGSNFELNRAARAEWVTQSESTPRVDLITSFVKCKYKLILNLSSKLCNTS